MKNFVVDKICVSIEGKLVVKDLSFSLEPGSVTIIMGPNGSGKSSLALSIMGHPAYQIGSGEIRVHGASIVNDSPDKRARAGIFLAVQNPFEIPGVSVFSFIKQAYYACHGSSAKNEELRAQIAGAMKLVGLDEQFIDRSVNEGFSGGEKKRLELVQMLVLRPKIVILDEIDSGLDIDALHAVQSAITQLQSVQPETLFLIITHYPALARSLTVGAVYVMVGGTVVDSGSVVLADEIEKRGYESFKRI